MGAKAVKLRAANRSAKKQASASPASRQVDEKRVSTHTEEQHNYGFTDKFQDDASMQDSRQQA